MVTLNTIKAAGRAAEGVDDSVAAKSPAEGIVSTSDRDLPHDQDP